MKQTESKHCDTRLDRNVVFRTSSPGECQSIGLKRRFRDIQWARVGNAVCGLIIATAATAFDVQAAITPTELLIKREMQAQIKKNPQDLNGLHTNWRKQYGDQAVPALTKLARNSSETDTNRYVAILGLAKIQGRVSAPLLITLLKDKNWMVRNASLKALRVVGSSSDGERVIPLLGDPAWVVRSEAIETLKFLKPIGVEKALLASALNPAHYQNGKAIWIPKQAIQALGEIRSAFDQDPHVLLSVTNELRPLLAQADLAQDPELKQVTQKTLNVLK